jgi:hypothetical protein
MAADWSPDMQKGKIVSVPGLQPGKASGRDYHLNGKSYPNRSKQKEWRSISLLAITLPGGERLLA